MEHLALEIFDLATAEDKNPTTSKYAVLDDDASITITDTSEIFASGDVWSHSFTLNVHANSHIFGTAGDIHGSRLHDQIHKRRARLWVEGLPLFLGYLTIDDEAEVDSDGNVDVAFESGQKTFDELIKDTKAREVSVGDVVIGVALNRKRVVDVPQITKYEIVLDGLAADAARDRRIEEIAGTTLIYTPTSSTSVRTPYVQQFPKIVKSHGTIYNSEGEIDSKDDYTNIQTPYDDAHPFCNVNICYQMKVNKDGEDIVGRGYTLRLAHGNPTTDGGDGQTRYNNAPNFYLLHFVKRMFKDLGIHVAENQMLDVEDLRRVFLLNYGCHYEEIEDKYPSSENNSHLTPSSTEMMSRYGQYYIPVEDQGSESYLFKDYTEMSKPIAADEDVTGKVLLHDLSVSCKENSIETGYVWKDWGVVLTKSSVEGKIRRMEMDDHTSFSMERTLTEKFLHAYSAYLAYATGDNYPDADISEIIEAMKSMFGVRLLFNGDYTSVRIVLLRNVFRSNDIQDITCDIIGEGEKTESCVRGFRMTYGKGTDSTDFYYKGFADLFPRQSKAWIDTSDKHDYSQWDVNADYASIKQFVSSFNKKCYVTPVNGNAYGVKVDEDEDVLYPSLFEYAGFMDAEDGDCSGDDNTIEEVQCGASPVIMNDVNGTYASLFSGDMKAPTPENYEYATKVATFGRTMRVTNDQTMEGEYFRSINLSPMVKIFTVTGKPDIFLSEGFQIRMEDNYSISNGGTPFDEADTGLQFGIMRSSGSDAYISYSNDNVEDEDPINDYWEAIPGSSAVSHPDTCDEYGNLWDYYGERKIVINGTAAALSELAQLFPNSNAPFYRDGKYIIGASVTGGIPDDTGQLHSYLIATCYGNKYNETYSIDFGQGYIPSWVGKSVSDVLAMDAADKQIIVEVDSSNERRDTLLEISKIAKENLYRTIVFDNGVDSRFGRFSLKLRAEKLNPYYVEGSTDPQKKDRYLHIDNEDLQGRGLCDQFYKEYSYWACNARIKNIPVRMELAQLLAIDKTVRACFGDVTGFIRKLQYTISNKTGLGEVNVEVMYI